ncbi:PREDICTED: amine oxidase [flavin-containing] A-like [Priapulus caudatus]|uniref:Amine oxidase n=1 Tax=Priapulus caudatus TaxID=37621 RepID=A0ABM1ES64_PRICU|nr:PREDICTED: amine oxidase [flavin-containing] A-like [Priapulus caudatus]
MGYTDFGGAYVGPTQNRVLRLAKELGLTFYYVNEKELSIDYRKGKRRMYQGTIPPVWNPLVLLDLNNVMREVDAFAKLVPVDAPWSAERAVEWDSMTVKEYISKACWFSCTASVMRLAVSSLLTSEPHELSFLSFLWYIHSGQGILRMANITNGAQERKFVGGAQQLSERMAERLGTRVKLSQPCIRVEQTQNGDYIITTKNNDHYRANHIISAVPQALLNRIEFIPTLPPLKIQLIQRIPMGSIIKTMTFYKTAFWRDYGCCGSVISHNGPVVYCIDDTKPDGSFPCIMGFVVADRARELCGTTPEERKKTICKHYVESFGMKEFMHPVNYAEKNWMEEEYSGGCYTSGMPPGVLTKYGRVLREPFGDIYFAGTESATYWSGYMEGAIQAGERAAREVLAAMGTENPSNIDPIEPADADVSDTFIGPSRLELMLPSLGALLTLSSIGGAVIACAVAYKYI